jgi:hypothetical protein
VFRFLFKFDLQNGILHSSKFVNFHNKKCAKFLSNQKLSTKPAHLQLSFGTFISNLCSVYFPFVAIILHLWFMNFLCQKSGLMSQDKRSYFFPIFSVCVLQIILCSDFFSNLIFKTEYLWRTVWFPQILLRKFISRNFIGWSNIS